MTWTRPISSTTSNTPLRPTTTKRLLFLRHGQAQHNPRAEEAKDRGCSHETFLQLMKEDDAFDAELTCLGQTQAIMARERHLHRLQKVQLVVSSPLSRAIQTANLVMEGHPHQQQDDRQQHGTKMVKRVCVELFREINGWLLNAKRRTKTDLQERFHPSCWDFSGLSMEDETWTEILESEKSCAERYYQGLLWLLRDREEEVILTVAHGGLLRFGMVDHPNVCVVDNRGKDEKRFGNCELREYEAQVVVEVPPEVATGIAEVAVVTPERPLIVLQEIIHS